MPRAVERIVRSGVAYQAAAFLSAGLAFFTFHAYTVAIGVDTLGQADLILAWLILASIGARLGFGEALLRHWFTAGDPERPRLQRTIQGSVLIASAVLAVVVWGLSPAIAGQLDLIDDAWVIRVAGVGLFAYTNLDIAQTLLRARDDHRIYLLASVTNVLLTVCLTVLLVIVLGQGVKGYLVGNYAASAVILLWLWSRELPVYRGRVSAQPALVDPEQSLVVGRTEEREIGEQDHPVAQAPDAAAALSQAIKVETIESAAQTRAASRGDLRALLRFGVPTIPTDAAIFGFNILDRTVLAAVGTGAVVGEATPLGVFSAASKIAAGVILVARAFQLAFPPLAYSIVDKNQASEVYASALRGYAVVLGGTVAGVALSAPWTVELLIGVKPGEPDARAAVIEILPLLAAAWALWGVVPVMTTIAGRIGATQLTVPAALVGLAVNVVALVLLVPPYGAHGAAGALVIAYVVLIGTLHLLTHRYFPVAFDLPRIGVTLALSASVCLLAGPLAHAPQLGWGPAMIRMLLFVALLVVLWTFGLKSEERAGLARAGKRLTFSRG